MDCYLLHLICQAFLPCFSHYAGACYLLVSKLDWKFQLKQETPTNLGILKAMDHALP